MQKIILVCCFIAALFVFSEAQVYPQVVVPQQVVPVAPVAPLASLTVGRRRRSPMPKPKPGILKGAAIGALAGGTIGAIGK